MKEFGEILDMDLLQEQTDIIESKLLQAGGALALLAMMRSETAQEAGVCIGEAMSALLKIKKELDLDTNLSEEEGVNR
jgi:hypothetical protein